MVILSNVNMHVLLNRQSWSRACTLPAPVTAGRCLGIEEMRLCVVRAENVLCSLAVLLVDRAPHVCARCSDPAHPTSSLRGWFTSGDMKDHGNALWCCLPRTALSFELSHWEMATSKLYIALTPYRRFHCSETSE